MFLRSPFDPIEDVVAEAKQERAQLGRLLKLSTPRERVLVALTALVVLLFGAWLLFGDITRNLTVKGVLVAPGQQEQEMTSGTSLKVVVWLQADAAHEIEAGMPALIEVDLLDGTARRLAGKIARLAPVPLPDRLRPVDSKAPVSMREIEVLLENSHQLDIPVARACRIIVDLGGQSPIALFGPRQS